ncbi:MAG: hypothetical protein ACK4TL_12990 [Hyphomicrobiaceae bacterium]
MRRATACAVVLALLPGRAHAEPLTIDQNAWLNYAVIVTTTGTGSSVKLNQHGEINGISSVQISGARDAEIQTHQSGRRNNSVIYQSGWLTASVVVQEGPHGLGGDTNLPTRHIRVQTDEGYLSYFATGGFSLVTLTDPNHTWFSRFGRAR